MSRHPCADCELHNGTCPHDGEPCEPVQRPNADPVAIVLATVHRVAPLPVNVHVSSHILPGTYACTGESGPFMLSRADYDRLRATIEESRRV